MIDLIIDPSHNLKRTKIEPFIIPKEKLDELKKALENPKCGLAQRNTIMRQIGGCLVCGQIATKLVKYRTFGITRIEKYCDYCLARKQKKLI